MSQLLTSYDKLVDEINQLKTKKDLEKLYKKIISKKKFVLMINSEGTIVNTG